MVTNSAILRPFGLMGTQTGTIFAEWLKQWHEGTIRPLQVQPTHDSWTAVSSPPMYMTIALIFFTVDTLRAESWTYVEWVLEQHHAVLVAMDSRW